jgi:HEAT repeat protein
VAALDDEDSSVQQNAQLALAEIRTPEVADALVKVIANSDGRDVPYTVIDALGELGGPHAAEAILKVIPAYDGLQNWCALLALRSIEQPASGARDDVALKRGASTFQQSPADAMDALFQLLDQGNWKTKTEAMKGLVFVRDPSATTRLLERTESDDSDVRLLATGLLALYDEPAPPVAEAILKARKSPDPAVRRFALLSDACQSQADFPQWCVEALDDDDYVVRIIALRKLSKLNNPKFAEAVNAGKTAEPAWIKAYVKGLKPGATSR